MARRDRTQGVWWIPEGGSVQEAKAIALPKNLPAQDQESGGQMSDAEIRADYDMLLLDSRRILEDGVERIDDILELMIADIRDLQRRSE